MSAGSIQIGSERAGEWLLEFFEHAGSYGARAHGVDISRAGRRRGRISLSRSAIDHESAIIRLRPKALAWIADYEGRDHAGDTEPGDLS